MQTFNEAIKLKSPEFVRFLATFGLIFFANSILAHYQNTRLQLILLIPSLIQIC